MGPDKVLRPTAIHRSLLGVHAENGLKPCFVADTLDCLIVEYHQWLTSQ
jgi:hypothetical protein